MNTQYIRIGDEIFQREAICRVKYVKADETGRFDTVVSSLHIWMIDGKDFTIFNEAADTLWEAFKASSFRIA